MSVARPKTIRCFCGELIADKAVLVATCGVRLCVSIGQSIRAKARRETQAAMDELYERAGAKHGRGWPHLRGCRCFCCAAVRKALKHERPAIGRLQNGMPSSSLERVPKRGSRIASRSSD